MDVWQWAVSVIAWLVLSIPLGLAVGRCIAHGQSPDRVQVRTPPHGLNPATTAAPGAFYGEDAVAQ